VSEWKRDNGKYVHSNDLFIGKWKACSVYYDGGVSKGQENKYAVGCGLPGLKDRHGHFMTEVDAMVKAESLLAYWLRNANLEETKQ